MSKLLNNVMMNPEQFVRWIIVLLLGFPTISAAQAADPMSSRGHTGPVMNYHVINNTLATGGHLTEGGLDYLVTDGVQRVVDLRDEPPSGQQERLAAVGIEWISVPIVWKEPRPEDFEKFKAAMSSSRDAKVLVQCQANYRASAMTFLYRVTVLGVPKDEAVRDLHEIWTPNEQWQSYIDSILEAKAPSE